MTEVHPLNLFLATPSDASPHRDVIRAAVREWNTFNRSRGVQFHVLGYESVRGTAVRAQEAINELIAESHFLLAVFNERWGSETGSSWGYTSGTEEELFRGLLELGQADQPMRDVWVAFMDVSHAAPEVTQLKEQLVNRHSMLFDSASDEADLGTKIRSRLSSWADNFGDKTARHVELATSGGGELLRAAQLKIHGEKLIELGEFDTGIKSLEQASTIGGPEEKLVYARHLARMGDLETASDVTKDAIELAKDGDFGLFSTMAAEAFAAQAGYLRRQGKHRAAIGRVQQAMTLIKESNPEARRVRARAFDEIGLAYKALGDPRRAKAEFLQSLEVREIDNVATQVAQSRINLARLAVEEQDLGEASDLLEHVLSDLENLAPTALSANAEVLAAQVRLRMGDASQAVEHGLLALELNRQFGNSTGEAIALNLLAQCYRSLCQFQCAIDAARACLEINEKIGNARGVDSAQWQIDAAMRSAEAHDSHLFIEGKRSPSDVT